MRVVLITGASSGIGLATAKKLAGFGFNLILCGRNEKRLVDLKNTLSKLTSVVYLVFDVRNKNDVFKQIGSLNSEWGNIEILINNAGNAHGKNLLVDDDIENWDSLNHVINISL